MNVQTFELESRGRSASCAIIEDREKYLGGHILTVHGRIGIWVTERARRTR